MRILSRWFPPKPTKLEYLRMMDRISEEVRYVDLQRALCVKGKRRNEKAYWERMWEALVTVYEEFEWGLHPKNKERIWEN